MASQPPPSDKPDPESSAALEETSRDLRQRYPDEGPAIGARRPPGRKGSQVRAEPPTASGGTTSGQYDFVGSRSPQPEPRTGVWIFYGRDPGDEADWLSNLKVGSAVFWIHGAYPKGGAYKRQLRKGDTVVLVLKNEIHATGLLIADDSQTFVDAAGRIRRPVLIVEIHTPPLDRRLVEQQIERSLIRQGAVHPVTAYALDAINRLRERVPAPPLPWQAEGFQAFASPRPLLNALDSTKGYILPDDATARIIGWSGHLWTPTVWILDDPPNAKIDETPEVADPPPPGHGDLDAQIPFVLDAPADTEDELDRGPFALFLAQRLHLIWCQMNGHAPDGKGGRTKASPPDSDTFIVHVDSPWGGGKTTFANFIARVLDPRGQTLSPRHFLRPSLAPTLPDDALAGVRLDDVFVPPYARSNADAWPGARRPWVVVRYNAWRDQYVQPPWWQVFLNIQSAVARDLLHEAGAEFRAGLNDPPRLEKAAARLWAWAWVKLERLRYQIWNRKLQTQVWVWIGLLGLLAICWQTGLVEQLLKASVAPEAKTSAAGALEAKRVSDWITLGVTVLGLGGASLATLFTLVGQSLAPDLDFTAEHKQIGVQDPISRFRKTFDRILRATDRPVLLIVDDVDRCDPKTVVELMRGFQTIIRSPRLFVLLLGDRAWIENAHDVHHKDLTGVHEGEASLGARFVQKVIQLSFRLPTMKAEARTRFARQVLGDTPGDVSSARVTAVLREVDAKVSEIVKAEQSVGNKEARVSDVVEAAKSALPDDLSAAERVEAGALVEKLAVGKIVASAGADAAQQRSVFNAVTRLVDSLPNNPRQIKRIFMAFATYEVVGRSYFGYQLTPEGPDGERRARRWRQLAMWVTLAIEWPETWRAIARRPELLTRAFGPKKGRKTADEKFIGALAEADRPPALAILRRLRTDRALVALLSRQDDAPAAAGEFAATAMEAEAVFEFNRIIWEPDFRLYADG